jgi:hypothetical protein
LPALRRRCQGNGQPLLTGLGAAPLVAGLQGKVGDFRIARYRAA